MKNKNRRPKLSTYAGITHISASSKLLKLKNSHRTIPDDSLGGVQRLTESLDGIRANIETHPTVRDRRCRNNLQMVSGISISIEWLENYNYFNLCT